MLRILSHQSKTQSEQYTLLGGKPEIATLVKKIGILQKDSYLWLRPKFVLEDYLTISIFASDMTEYKISITGIHTLILSSLRYNKKKIIMSLN